MMAMYAGPPQAFELRATPAAAAGPPPPPPPTVQAALRLTGASIVSCVALAHTRPTLALGTDRAVQVRVRNERRRREEEEEEEKNKERRCRGQEKIRQ